MPREDHALQAASDLDPSSYFASCLYETNRFSVTDFQYLLWMFVWIGWNVFVSCLYLDLGGLSKDSHILSLGVSSHSSWWKDNGPGCQSQNPPSDRWSEHQNPQLASVPSCWLQYQYLEVLHCAAQLLLSVSLTCSPLLGVVCSCYAVSRFPEEESC
ncbi:hypothetical protein CCH79_00006496, partial [Gambusia affinis]